MLKSLTSLLAFVGVLAVCETAGFAQSKVEAEAPIMLRQFIVTATPISKQPWRYASFHGVEVISRGTATKALWWIHGLQRGFDLQEALLPKDLTGRFSTPSTLIIDDVAPDKGTTSGIGIAPAVAMPESDHPELTPRSGKTAVVDFLGNAYSFDSDTFAAASNLYGISDFAARTQHTINSEWNLPYRFARYAPLPPSWLRAGLYGKYGLMDTNVGGFTGTQEYPSFSAAEDYPQYLGKAQFWLTDEITAKIQSGDADAIKAIKLLPFDQLFSDTPPKAAVADLWACESALFIRWALMGHPSLLTYYRDPARAAALWKFVAAVSREPATEDIFRRCFGFGYDALNAELLQYLPTATREQPTVPASGEPPEVEFRVATNDEVGRILGDWLRMKGEALETTNPSLATTFFQQAGIVLLRAYRADLGRPEPSPGTFMVRHVENVMNSEFNPGNATSGVTTEPSLHTSSEITSTTTASEAEVKNLDPRINGGVALDPALHTSSDITPAAMAGEMQATNTNPRAPWMFIVNRGQASAARATKTMDSPILMQPVVVDSARIHDPAFLAVYGLYEHDVGYDKKAREFLEAAAKDGVERPAVYRELARLREAEATNRPTGPGGKLSAAQTAYALAPLLKARRMTPADIGNYGLMADIWLHSAAKPTSADLAFLTEAVALFPKKTEFANAAAGVYAKFGFASEASRIVESARKNQAGLGLKVAKQSP